MDTPNTIPKQSLPEEPTGPYPSALRAQPAERIKVALIPASGSVPRSELESLLHKRLRILTLIWLVGLAIFVPSEFLWYELKADLVWYVLVPLTALLAASLACALILCRNRPLSLARLRGIELTQFGMATLAFSWNHYHLLRGWLPLYAQRSPIELAILATFESHIWFIL